MDFESVTADVVQVVEAVGVVLMVVGAIVSLGEYLIGVARRRDAVGAYDGLRRRLARVILLGLEVLLLADIIRTIVVDQTAESVLVLGAIVIIRIVLSFSLQVEIEGTWPWSRWRVEKTAPAAE
ncbi:MAG: DUF1622 domain-containing protein [Microthrixaceae bacterium]